MHPRLKTLLEELKQSLSALYGDQLSQIILFGSQARGDAANDSDIDLMVVLKGRVNVVDEIKRTNILLSTLSLEHEQDISCIFMPQERFDSEKSPLLLNVRREGAIL